MYKINDFIKNLTKVQKICCLIFILIFFLVAIISAPTLAKFKNRTTLYTNSAWDGTVATHYKNGDGTQNNPYIISNGSEFAYFKEQLKNTDYSNTYFKLSSDIIFNSGIFDYDNENKNLLYTINNSTYYVDTTTGEYYDNSEKNGSYVGKINTFESLSKFKGNLDGNSFIIFGLYIQSNEDQTGLFSELEGVVENLSIENSFIKGSKKTGGITGYAVNSTLNNVLYNGFVVNSDELQKLTYDIEPLSIQTTTEETLNTITLPNVELDNISSISLIGDYVVNTESTNTTIKINNQEITGGHFEIDLGSIPSQSVSVVSLSDQENITVNFSNLKYIVNYNDSITSGIVSVSNNTSINNTINKAKIYGNYITSGIVGKAENTLIIKQSYNKGSILGNYISSGIIGLIENNQNYIELNKIYNSGDVSSSISSGIIGIATSNVGIININNSFNVSNNYSINKVSNSIINVNNCYNVNNLSIYSGSLSNNFNVIDVNNLYNKEFLTGTLKYASYIDNKDVKTNLDNVWVFEDGVLPKLYIDEIEKAVASINITNHSWKNYSTELSIINLTSNITFSLEELSNTDPLQEKYYYISNNKSVLSKQELDNVNWVNYENIVQISEPGYYVIYSKLVKYDGTVEYINSDILALNTNSFDVELVMNNYIWNDSSLSNEIYINEPETLSVVANCGLVGISNIEYLISSELLTQENLNDATWIQYNDSIEITTIGKYIVYVKVTNNESQVKYINSDYIVFDGYKQNILLGKNNNDYDSNSITSKSSVTINFINTQEINFKDNYIHVFTSSINLPINTKITMIDRNLNKIYNYVVENENVSSIELNEFKEIGMSINSYYDETINYNKTLSGENYTFIIDFINTESVQNNLDVTFDLSIKYQNNYIYQTLKNELKPINIYIDNVEIQDKLYISHDYLNQTINYNTDTQNNINLTNKLNYTLIDNIKIIDTTLENLNKGIEIKILDSNSNVVSREKLENIIFKLDQKDYGFNEDNSIKINIGNSIDPVINNLQIITTEGNKKLEDGNYYIYISYYISEDGYNYSKLNSNSLVIPMIVNNSNEENNNNFILENTSEIYVLNSKLEEQKIIYNVVEPVNLDGLSVKVSLYEKESLTAYDQGYKLVNLQEYTSDILTNISNSTYLLNINNIELNLIPNKFNKTGYKFVFEFYNGDTRIKKLEKYFIVR